MITVQSTRLSNGIRLLHHHDATTQMVALNLLYDVGARDENCGQTGFAHLFEHLMFGGSANIPNFDIPLQEAGGDSNAWTSCDITNFYETLPAHNIETALWLESDRLNSLAFTQHAFDIQKDVVIEEFKQRCINVPYGDLDHILKAEAYKVHPYRWPVIGIDIREIENATLDDARNFFYAHYAPNNLIMCVAGNITFDDTVKLVEKWMGDIPMRDVKPRNLPAEPAQEAPRRKEVNRQVPQTVIIKAYHTCGRRHPDFQTCDMISDILANGNSARFFKNILMQTDIFTDLDASVTATIDPGLLLIKGRLQDNTSIDKAEKAIDSEIKKLIDGDVSDYEIKKYSNKFDSKECFENISYSEKASKLCYYELLSKADDINTEVEKYKMISTEKVAKTATRLFDKSNETTIIYGPNV